jgi:hypothetical protein
MKKKSMFLVVITLLLSVLAISPSYANGCSLEDPCETWAILDDNNKVINIIVCQPSVCGSGVWDGKRVVRQIASNPSTNDTKNTGGYNSDSNRTVTYNDTNSTFTVLDSGPVESTVVHVTENVTQNVTETVTQNVTETVTENVTETVTENVVTVISTTISQQPKVTFTYNDTKADPTKPIENKEYTEDTKATVSITEVKITSEDVSSTTGKVTFENRVTADDAVEIAEDSFSLDSYLSELFVNWFPVWGSLLGFWII